MKHKIKIAISIVLIVLAIWLVYQVLAKTSKGKQSTPSTSTQPSETTQPKATQTIYDQLFPVLNYQNKLLDEDIYFPSFDQSSNLLYFYGYQDKAGIYSFDLNSRQKKLVAEFEDINNISYSPDHSRAIFSVSYQGERFEKYQSPFLTSGIKDGELTYWYYDFSSKKLKKLNRNIQNLFWINDREIIFHYYDWNQSPQENYLGKIDLAVFQSEKIIDINYYQVDFLSVQSNRVFIQNQPTEYPAVSPLLVLDLNAKTITPLFENQNFIGDKDSFDGQFLSLFSHNEQDNNFQLKVYDLTKNQLIESEISTNNTTSGWSKDNSIYLVIEKNNQTSISSFNPVENKVRQLQIDVPKDVAIDKILSFNNKIYLLANNFIYQYDTF